MAELDSAKAERSQRLIRVRDAFRIIRIYRNADRVRMEKAEQVAGSYIQAATTSMAGKIVVAADFILNPPKTWSDIATNAVTNALRLIPRASLDNLLVEQAEREFSTDEQIANALLNDQNGILTQNNPRNLISKSPKSRGQPKLRYKYGPDID